MSFSELGLSEALLRAVADQGYTEPTPIQLQAIPAVLAGGDLLAGAQTGTGKTAGFVLPMLQRLTDQPSPYGAGRSGRKPLRALILTPTRELAAQVEESIRVYGKHLKITSMVLFGGVSLGPQTTALKRGIDILVATPGRLLDHHGQGHVDFSQIEIFVLDEADRMLDMGFIPDIERICKLVPFTRQTLFFTATMPPEIRRIVDTFLHNPEQVEVSRPATTVAAVTQLLAPAGREPHDKRDALRRFIRSEAAFKNAIIFCNRKREVAVLHRSLVRHGFNAVALHGDMDQPARTAALDQFRRGEVKLLIASDVAARGLDIPDVSHIFNYDVPHHADDYVHRIGRTGRAGKSGTAITLVTPADRKAVDAIERLIGRTIEWAKAAPRPERQEQPEQPAREPRHRPRPAPRRPERPSAPQTAQVARIEEARAQPRHAPRDHGVDTSGHLPAFLFRPARVKA